MRIQKFYRHNIMARSCDKQTLEHIENEYRKITGTKSKGGKNPMYRGELLSKILGRGEMQEFDQRYQESKSPTTNNLPGKPKAKRKQLKVEEKQEKVDGEQNTTNRRLRNPDGIFLSARRSKNGDFVITTSGWDSLLMNFDLTVELLGFLGGVAALKAGSLTNGNIEGDE